MSDFAAKQIIPALGWVALYAYDYPEDEVQEVLIYPLMCFALIGYEGYFDRASSVFGVRADRATSVICGTDDDTEHEEFFGCYPEKDVTAELKLSALRWAAWKRKKREKDD